MCMGKGDSPANPFNVRWCDISIRDRHNGCNSTGLPPHGHLGRVLFKCKPQFRAPCLTLLTAGSEDGIYPTAVKSLGEMILDVECNDNSADRAYLLSLATAAISKAYSASPISAAVTSIGSSMS